MKRMPFEPPTDHYDERIQEVDEQICSLINQRKDISNNNPGFPTKQLISSWSKKFNLYEDFLNGVFAHFLNEEIFKPVVEPKGFIKNVPILQSFEKDDLFYTITFMRQYENASVIHLLVDGEDYDEIPIPGSFPEHTYFELSIEGYDCRNDGGGGSRGHMAYTYVVSPPLPDDISKVKVVFKEYQTPFKGKPTGVEFSF